MISLVCPNLEKLGRCRMSSNQQLYHNDAKETKQLPQAIQSSSSPPTSSSPSSKTLVAATAAAKNSFPFKLYRCLEDAAIDESKAEIISWLPDGKGFKVHKPNEFVDQLLVRYFKTQTKLKSFTRQLYIYGFSKISTGSNSGGFFHPLFVRGDQESMLLLGRNKCQDRRFKRTPAPSPTAKRPASQTSSDSSVGDDDDESAPTTPSKRLSLPSIMRGRLMEDNAPFHFSLDRAMEMKNPMMQHQHQPPQHRGSWPSFQPLLPSSSGAAVSAGAGMPLQNHQPSVDNISRSRRFGHMLTSENRRVSSTNSLVPMMHFSHQSEEGASQSQAEHTSHANDVEMQYRLRQQLLQRGQRQPSCDTTNEEWDASILEPRSIEDMQRDPL